MRVASCELRGCFHKEYAQRIAAATRIGIFLSRIPYLVTRIP